MQPTPFDTEVRLAVYHYLAENGRRPPVEQIAEKLEVSVGRILAAYERLEAQRLLVLEPDRANIRMAPPFSGVPTQHVVESGGVRFFANCAWDALAVLAALRRPGVVRSSCAGCGEALYLPVGVGGPEPSDWLFHTPSRPLPGGTISSSAGGADR